MREYKLRETNYKIRYNDFFGEMTPIIFIHGLGCAGSFDDVEVASALQSNQLAHRLILIDLLGGQDIAISRYRLNIQLLHMQNT